MSLDNQPMEVAHAELRPRLLIVDDEPKNLRLLANIFSDDYRLSLATSGAKALELLDITPDVELVLLDVMMPEMDGLAVFERIRAHPDRQDLPVIFVTARNDAALEMRALGSGAADYLLKPVHVGLARVRVRQQITLARQRQELQRARAAADAGSRAKSQFLTAVSHELRTPLNAILGFSQVLESDDELSPNHRAQVREIRDAGVHLLALINDVLDLGKIEAAKVELEPETIDLAELGHACLRLCEPLSSKRGVLVKADFEPDAPLAWADRIRVRQVVVNLLSNAIKFNRAGGQVELRLLRAANGAARIEIVDDGPGIDAELKQRLFEPFTRGAESERLKIEGTGIGLTICKRLVTLMGGQIDCISIPGLGSRFWFTLPASDAQAWVAAQPGRPAVPKAPSPAHEPLPLQVHKPMGTTASSLQANKAPSNPMPAAQVVGVPFTPAPAQQHTAQRPTILCIDDNPANLMLLQIVLKRLPGVDVVASADPHQAVALAAEHRPALALVDIQMPEVDGFEVLARLRAMPPLAHMPVAALSANAMADDIRTGLAAGFVAYFTKPFDVQELLSSVQGLLERALAQQNPPLAPYASSQPQQPAAG